MECFRKLAQASAGPAAAAPPSRRWLIKVCQTDSSLEDSQRGGGGGGGEQGPWILQLLSAKRNKSPLINFPRFCSFLPPTQTCVPHFSLSKTFPAGSEAERRPASVRPSGSQRGPPAGTFLSLSCFRGKITERARMVKIATFAKAVFLSGELERTCSRSSSLPPTPSSLIHHISLVTVVFRTRRLLIAKSEMIVAVYKAKLAASPKFLTLC